MKIDVDFNYERIRIYSLQRNVRKIVNSSPINLRSINPRKHCLLLFLAYYDINDHCRQIIDHGCQSKIRKDNMSAHYAYKGRRQCSKETAERITKERIDDSNLELIKSIHKIRALIQLLRGPRFLMDLYNLIGHTGRTAEELREIEAIGLITFSTLNRKRVVELTEKGEEMAAHMKAILDLLDNNTESHAGNLGFID